MLQERELFSQSWINIRCFLKSFWSSECRSQSSCRSVWSSTSIDCTPPGRTLCPSFVFWILCSINYGSLDFQCFCESGSGFSGGSGCLRVPPSGHKPCSYPNKARSLCFYSFSPSIFEGHFLLFSPTNWRNVFLSVPAYAIAYMVWFFYLLHKARLFVAKTVRTDYWIWN